MPRFIPGLELSRLFYEEAVRPILTREFPALRYSAALLGGGSEVLGYDTPQSTDHHWGPRLMLFVSEEDHAQVAETVRERLRHELPTTFRGYSTSYSPLKGEPGTLMLEERASGPVNHRVEILTARGFVRDQLGIDPEAELSAVDWLVLSEQQLLSVTAGEVYHDGTGDLERYRGKLAYYPRDVWLYLLAAQWQRLGQEEAFVGRAGAVGDEIGSQVIAARLVRDLMRLCFLMERQYAPYPKWFGTAFSRLERAPRLQSIFDWALHARDWHEREYHLSAAYRLVAEHHNALGITPVMATDVSPFHARPYLVIHGDQFAEAIWSAIEDPVVKALPRFVGGVDQWVDSADVLSHPERCLQLRALYERGGREA